MLLNGGIWLVERDSRESPHSPASIYSSSSSSSFSISHLPLFIFSSLSHPSMKELRRAPASTGSDKDGHRRAPPTRNPPTMTVSSSSSLMSSFLDELLQRRRRAPPSMMMASSSYFDELRPTWADQGNCSPVLPELPRRWQHFFWNFPSYP
jgi:hypothetical protein